VAKESELQAVDLDVRIDAEPARVFAAIVDDTGAWWGAPYLHGPARAIVVEAAVGGRVYEDWGDGEGALWANVTQIRFGRLLEMTGRFGGMPSVVTFRLEPDGGGTRVAVRQEWLVPVDGAVAQNYARGWKDLVGVRLTRWVEAGRRMGLGHEPEEDA
jgi:uncharacterized protein YndB with AHSA1/START domain